MYVTEKEIGLEFESIRLSVAETVRRKDEIGSAFKEKSRCWFIGCGSSYALSKSAASILFLNCGIDAYAVAAGDILLHFERYGKALQDSIVIFLSRSGCTTEVVEAAKLIRVQTNADCLSVCAREESILDGYCSLNIHIPWAFDDSVCQTKTVGSLYACVAAMSAIISGDDAIIGQFLNLPDKEKVFKAHIMDIVAQLSAARWNHAVILADSETAGIMEEGALACKEICQINSNFYHVLDVRHGPMVMIDEQTFVFILLEEPTKMVIDLVADIKAKGAFCVVAGPYECDSAADATIAIPEKGAVISGIYSLYFLQWATLRKAIMRGINPDEPDGLKPWIEIS